MNAPVPKLIDFIKLKPILDQRISLMAHSLYGLFTGSSDSSKKNIQNILMRAVILVQKQVTFLLYVRSEDGYNNIEFKSYIKQDEKKMTELLKRHREDYQKHLIQLFETDFYILPIHIRKEIYNEQLNLPIKHVFEIIRAVTEEELYSRTEAMLESLKSQEEILKENKVTQLDLIYYQIKKLFNPNQYTMYDQKDEIIAKFEQTLAHYKSSEERQKKNWQISENTDVQHVFNEIVSKETAKHFESFKKLMLSSQSRVYQNLHGYGYLDSVFSKISKALVHLDSEKNDARIATNYIFITRDYTRSTKRHNEFDFNVQIMISDQQTKEIKKLFQHYAKISLRKKQYNHLKSGYVSSLNPYYTNVPSKLPKKYAYHSYIHPIAKFLNDWFWNQLNGGNLDTTIDEFIRILKKPFGDDARSIADLVFNDIAHIRKPFDDGAIPRCFSNKSDIVIIGKELEKDSQHFEENYLNDDLKRLVIAYYWYVGMFEISDHTINQQLELILLPVEVGGSTWGVMGYFFKSPIKNISRYKIDIESNEHYWYKLYQLYQNINPRLKKELRYNLEEAYLNELANIYTSITYSFAGHSHVEDIITDVNRFKNNANEMNLTFWQYWQVVINARFYILTKYFPYAQITIDINKGKGEPMVNTDNDKIRNGIHLTNEYYASIPEGQDELGSPKELTPNQFYDRTTSYGFRRYIHRLPIKVRLSEAMVVANSNLGRKIRMLIDEELNQNT